MSAFVLRLGLLSALLAATSTQAAPVTFTVESVARQMISSPLLGPAPVPFLATGTQDVTVDTMAGTADITSDLKGISALGPYDLYNTTTIGTVTPVMGGFEVNFDVLFELAVTAGPLAGVVFETLDFATFTANVASIPYGAGVVFQDPDRPNDAVPIYLKSAAGIPELIPLEGQIVGASFDRTVTTVPEPTSMALFGLTAVGFGVGFRRRRGGNPTGKIA